MNSEDSLRNDHDETVLPSSSGIAGERPYRIVSQFGQQHGSLLYHAVRLDDGASIDVCVLSDLAEPPQQRIRKRIALVRQLQHPAIARVFEVDDQEKRLSCVLEPLSGKSLADLVSDREVIGPAQRVSFAKQIVSAVASAHRLGLAHGAISPEAVWVREDGGLQLDYLRPQEAKTLVQEPGADLSTMESEGESEYSAPELGDPNDADLAADLYSLGHLLSWLIGGHGGATAEEFSAVRAQLQSYLGESGGESHDVIEGIIEAVSDACSMSPDERGSAAELFRALDQLPAQSAHHSVDASLENDPGATTTALPDEGVGEITSDLLDTLLVGDHAAPAPSATAPKPQIGRFRIVRKLGEGGMGAVFQAEDTSDRSTVAVKVLSPRVLESRNALRRFHKEARMLGEIRSPFVTNLIEVNRDGRVHYLVMEYVQGKDLRRMLRKQRRLDEQVALSLAADVARGLVNAHERGIIHRDIKPGNVLLARRADAGDVELSSSTLHHFQVKLSDFGLAREIEQSESMQMTQEGGFIGTPSYMAPEQFDGQPLSPASDVYSLGITLYEMLCGEPPFGGSDISELINKHCNESPPAITRKRSDVSEATSRLVQRAISKKPDDRFADAGQFLREVERLLRGEPTTVEAHPSVPHSPPGKLFEEVFEWDLEAEPSQLWPYVSNTDRINQSVGVPSVVYDTKRDEHGRLRKYGNFRMAGLQISWEEHPFEWIEGQRLGILREFHQGPFTWFLSIVELQPRMEGGTHLKHTVRILPRGLVGKAVATMEVTVKGKRNLDRVYRRIDQAVLGRLGTNPTLDPFTTARSLTGSRRRQLESRLDELARRGVDPKVTDCLARFLTESPSQELGRIRPAALARNFSVPQSEMVDACLNAAAVGLLDLHWDILCPTCRISSQVAPSLCEIKDHANCEVCDLDFEVDLAGSVEMVFRAHPGIREADIGTYCIGGPEHSPHVVVQLRMQPKARVEISPLLAESEYVLRSAQLPMIHRIRALPGKGSSHCEVVLSERVMEAPESIVRAGRTELTITNDYDREVVVRLERSVPVQDVVTAAKASSLPLFQDLFPDESLSSGALVRVSTVTLLAVELFDLDHLFLTASDAEAYREMQRFHQAVSQVAGSFSARIMNFSGTERMLVFDTPRSLIDAVARLAAALDDGDRSLTIRAAAHQGTALATSDEASLDYFGRTIHTVQRLLPSADSNQLLITEQLACDPLIDDAISQHGLQVEFADVPELGPSGARCRRVSFASSDAE